MIGFFFFALMGVSFLCFRFRFFFFFFFFFLFAFAFVFFFGRGGGLFSGPTGIVILL